MLQKSLPSVDTARVPRNAVRRQLPVWEEDECIGTAVVSKHSSASHATMTRDASRVAAGGGGGGGGGEFALVQQFDSNQAMHVSRELSGDVTANAAQEQYVLEANVSLETVVSARRAGANDATRVGVASRIVARKTSEIQHLTLLAQLFVAQRTSSA